VITARLDPSLSVRVVERRELRYDAELGREVGWGWVRAGSALARVGKRLVIVQDDALWLAWWDEQGKLSMQALPTDSGRRLFDDKRLKPDFEAALVVGQRLLVFGSGSLPSRERVTLVDEAGGARVVLARELYAALRQGARGEHALNVEGALLDGTRVVLYSRGNAAALVSTGFDVSFELESAELLRYLDQPAPSTLPLLSPSQRYQLGELKGVRLTLTDAALRDGKRYFIGAAEASPDAVADGAVLGTSFGVLGDDPRYALIEAEDGSLWRDKVEGLAPGRGDDEWLAVTDPDDASRPAELLTLRVYSA
jgi:hypothetical protein